MNFLSLVPFVSDRMRLPGPGNRLLFQLIVGCLFGIAGLTVPSTAESKVNVCRSASGKVSYREGPCPAKVEKSTKRSTKKNRYRKNRSRAKYRSESRASRTASKARSRTKSRRSVTAAKSRSSRKKRKMAKADSAGMGGICNMYSNMIRQSKKRGVEYIDHNGKSHFRKDRQAMGKVRKAEKTYKQVCQ